MPPVFRHTPPIELVSEILCCFSLKSIYDSTWFSKNTIDLSALELLIPVLEPYYLPCKAKQYLYDLTTLRAVTILRQVLKEYNVILSTTEKTIGNKKSTLYQIQPTPSFKNASCIPSSLCVTFD